MVRVYDYTRPVNSRTDYNHAKTEPTKVLYFMLSGSHCMFIQLTNDKLCNPEKVNVRLRFYI